MEQQQLRDEAQAQIRRYNTEAAAWQSPYELWKQSQGLPTLRGFQVDNVYEVELTPWEARGGSGVFVNLDGTGGFNDSYVYELGARESSVPIKHIYDELVYVLNGRGATTVWVDEKKKQTFEWGKNSWFAIPPNAWHQYHNLSGTEPARYFAMTAAPRVIDTFQSLDFVFNNNHVFTDRFNDEEGYFKMAERNGAGHWWSTNYVADIMALAPAKRASAEEVERRARAGAFGLRGSVGGGEGEPVVVGHAVGLSFLIGGTSWLASRGARATRRPDTCASRNSRTQAQRVGTDATSMVGNSAWRSSPTCPPTATRTCSRIRSGSTSCGPTTSRSPSATACTSAWAPTSLASSSGSSSRSSWRASTTSARG